MPKKLKLKENEEKALIEFKDKIKSELGDKLVKIILYGSKARGDSRPDSDIDILVVVKSDSEKIRDIINNARMDVNRDYQYKIFISAKVFPLAEYKRFKKIPTIFMLNVSHDGITL